MEHATYRHLVQVVLKLVVLLPDELDAVERDANGALVSLAKGVHPLLVLPSAPVLHAKREGKLTNAKSKSKSEKDEPGHP